MDEQAKTACSPASTESQTVLTIENASGVKIKVQLSDVTQQNLLPASKSNETPLLGTRDLDRTSHHFITTGSITSPKRPQTRLDGHQMSAITSGMISVIDSLRDGWLSISDRHTRPLKTEDSGCCQEELFDGLKQLDLQNAALLTLVPGRIVQEQKAFRCFRVDMEWFDPSYNEHHPLDVSLREYRLNRDLLDLLQQMTSRLLIEALLRSPSSAELFHRSWQLRQRELEPLINSIAMSMRSLISHVSNEDETRSLLQRLGLSQPLPSVIAIENLLKKVDGAVYPPAVGPSTIMAEEPHLRIDRAPPENFLSQASGSNTTECDSVRTTPESSIERQPATQDTHESLNSTDLKESLSHRDDFNIFDLFDRPVFSSYDNIDDFNIFEAFEGKAHSSSTISYNRQESLNLPESSSDMGKDFDIFEHFGWSQDSGPTTSNSDSQARSSSSMDIRQDSDDHAWYNYNAATR